jgi:hypothetical protein
VSYNIIFARLSDHYVLFIFFTGRKGNLLGYLYHIYIYITQVEVLRVIFYAEKPVIFSFADTYIYFFFLGAL